MERGLWGQPARRTAEYHQFHDESEPNKRWLLIGLLFLGTRHPNEVRAVPKKWRSYENYCGEIHFADLPKSFGGNWTAKGRVAREWMRGFQNSLNDRVFFSALTLDRHGPRHEHQRFCADFQAYNRFTAMAKPASPGTLGHRIWTTLPFTSCPTVETAP
ncbi:MAG: hypothetical protein QHJ34_10555 [bacterium]|jgi:hypothetical protein|nr:hypothetical protein [candidate division KSB1 bacterium]MDH7560653.1 hypothetical protein [bacterium]